MMRRVWINQPSIQQAHHNLHGRDVLVAEADFGNKDRSVRVWFTEGNVVSQMLLKLALSPGWKK